MPHTELPVIDGSAVRWPEPNGHPRPIDFEAARRRTAQRAALHRQQMDDLQEAASLAARQAHDQAIAAAYSNGRRDGYRRGYVQGTHWGLFAGFVAGAVAAGIVGAVAVVVRAHWPLVWQQIAGWLTW